MKNTYKVLLSILLLCILNVSVSCSGKNTDVNGDIENGGNGDDENNEGQKPGTVYSVNFEQGEVGVKMGKKAGLKVSFNSSARELEYDWSASNTAVVGFESTGKQSATVKGLNVGESYVYINAADNPLIGDTCRVVVTERGVVKILAVGNSFSEDAVEQNLYGLAEAEGIELIIGNMYIGGCTLETHWTNISNSATAYSYRKIVGGVKSTKPDTSVQMALADEEWDYISIQQASGYSGIYESYQPYLSNILSYLGKNAANPEVEFIFHQTWAYAQSSTHSDFPRYGNDQLKMYESIAASSKKAAGLDAVDILIPAGTAVQNGRTSVLGDTFTRDGYHLGYTYGRYTAACTWFEQLFEIDVRKNTYKPDGMSGFEAGIARAAAHAAVVTPYEITDLKGYKDYPPIVAFDKPIYIDFGNTDGITPSPWNNVTGALGATVILVDGDGRETGALLKITSPFAGVNTVGPASTAAALDLPATATKDSFYGNLESFGGKSVPAAEFEISRLDKGKGYDLSFFSSRMGVADNRETQFTVKGDGQEVVFINASNNTDTIAEAPDIKPDENGTITIEVTYGPDNDNSNHFYFINSMILSPSDN